MPHRRRKRSNPRARTSPNGELVPGQDRLPSVSALRSSLSINADTTGPLSTVRPTLVLLPAYSSSVDASAFACGCRISLRPALFVVDFSNGLADVNRPTTLIQRTAVATGVTSASSLAISPTSSTYATASPACDTLGCRRVDARTGRASAVFRRPAGSASGHERTATGRRHCGVRPRGVAAPRCRYGGPAGPAPTHAPRSWFSSMKPVARQQNPSDGSVPADSADPSLRR